MIYLLVFIMFFTQQVLAFQPADLQKGEILATGPCNNSLCGVFLYEEKYYIVEFIQVNGELRPIVIYQVDCGVLTPVWNILWRET